MNKKGIFFSLSVFLILTLLFILFFEFERNKEKELDFDAKKAQIQTVDHFVKDFDRYYIEEILSSSARPALVGYTNYLKSDFSKNSLVNIMIDGRNAAGTTIFDPLFSTDSGFELALGALFFTLDDYNFEYTLDDVIQDDYENFRLVFSSDYSFEFNGQVWSESNKQTIVEVSVYGMYHPDHNIIIRENWILDNSGGCYIEDIFSDLVNCIGARNIRPPAP